MTRVRVAAMGAFLIVLTLLLAWWTARGSGRADPEIVARHQSRDASAPSDLADGLKQDARSLAVPTARGVEREGAIREFGVELAAISVHAVWAETSAPIDGLEVLLVRAAKFRGMPANEIARGRTTSDGGCRFDALAPGKYGVYSPVGLSASVALADGETRSIQWQLAEGRRYECRVVRENGEPVAAAEIWFRPRIPGPESLLGTAGPDGRFIARGLSAQGGLFARDADHPPSEVFELDEAKETVLLTLVGRAGRIGGTVRGSGTPIAGAIVRLTGRSAPTPRELAPRELRLQTATDVSGGYVFAGLAAGAWTLQAWTGDTAASAERVDLEPGANVQVDLDLSEGGRLRGRILDDRNAAVPGALVRAGRIGSSNLRTSESDEFGNFELRGLARGIVEVVAAHPTSGRAAAEFRVEDRSVQYWNPALVRGNKFRGRVVARGATPDKTWSILARSLDGGDWSARTATRDSQFELEVRSDMRMRLEVFDPDGSPLVPLVTRDLESGADSVILELDAIRADCSLEGRVLDSSRAEYGGARVVLTREETDLHDVRSAGVDGQFAFERLLPGTYRLEVVDRARVVHAWADMVLTPGSRRSLGDLRLPAPGRLDVSVIPAGASSVAAFQVDLWRADLDAPVTSRGRVGESLAVYATPGSYRAQIDVDGCAPWSIEIALNEGDRRSIEVRPVPGVRFTLVTERPQVPAEFLPESVSIEDGDGRLAWRAAVANTGRRSASSLALPPGAYRARWLRGDEVVAVLPIALETPGGEYVLRAP